MKRRKKRIKMMKKWKIKNKEMQKKRKNKGKYLKIVIGKSIRKKRARNLLEKEGRIKTIKVMKKQKN